MLDVSCVCCECLALTGTKEKGSMFLCNFGMVVIDFVEVEDRAMYRWVVWVLD